MRRVETVLLLFALGLSGRAAIADDPPPIGAVADDAEKAFAASDAPGLASIAAEGAKAGADPWLVVDELLARGRAPVAGAFAKAAKPPDAEALAGFASRPLREPADARKRLAEMIGLASSGETDDVERAVDALARGESVPDGVLRVRWLEARARMLETLHRFRTAAAERRTAAESATRIGWRVGAAEQWLEAGRAHRRDGDLVALYSAWRTLADLQGAIGDADGATRTISDLGVIAGELGDHRQEVAHLEDAVRRLAPTRPSQDASITRLWLGRALGNAGDFARAIFEIDAAAAELSSVGDEDDRADADLARATLYFDLGDLARAHAAASSALSRWERAGASGAISEKSARGAAALARGTLANIYLEEGRLGEALSAYEAARKDLLETGDTRNAAAALHGLSEVRLHESKWDEARSLAVAASAETHALGDEEGRLRAEGNIAAADAGLGRFDDAERRELEVIAGAERRSCAGIVLEECARLATTRLAKRDLPGAVDAVERGLRVLSGLFASLAEGERVGARSRHADLFEAGMRVALKAGDDRLFFRYLEAARAGALIDSIENRDVLRDRRVDPALEAAREEAMRATLAAKARLDAAGEDPATARAASAELAASRARHEGVVVEIQRKHRAAAQLAYPQPDELKDAAAALADDEAVVTYVVLGKDVSAFVLTRAGGTRVPVGTLATVTAACDAAAELPQDVVAAKAALAALSRVLLAPALKGLAPSIRRVYISPDGPLVFVPFAALETVGAAKVTALVPSATTLHLLRDDGRRRGQKTLAIGISKYGARPAPLAAPSSAAPAPPKGSAAHGEVALLRDRALVDLPSAEPEAKSVGDVLLLGADATRAALSKRLAESPRWRSIHFACHGLVDRERPSMSALALHPGPDDDGFLTTVDVFDLVAPADLTVLSACDSGVGRVVRGEGLVGFVRAFLFAGSPRVLVSLWPVDDAATFQFMKAFYGAWNAGAATADALRTAQESVRREAKWAHPRYWAAWTLWGLGS